MDYEKKYKEAQKWIESIYSELSHEQQMEAEAFFPELKESEDERIRKEIIATIHLYYGEPLEDEAKEMIAWLEKQGEQEEPQVYETKDGEIVTYSETDGYKIVEPKFKVGDWIVSNEKLYVYQIEEINEFVVKVREINGETFVVNVNCLKDAHLWTIADAKDGDVLVCPLPKGCESGEQIFIFKGINSRDYVDNCIEYYCRICDGVFYVNENGYMGTTSSPLYPATKEQRDTLFAKMKEAGYEWDTEKKELKKISQRMVSAEAKEALYDKPAWSEEDDNCLSTIIAEFSKCSGKSVSKDEWMRCNDFLNSLKGRVQPQKQWKPSAGQMKALHDLNLTGNISYAGQGQILIELYNDLKKLTE